MKAPRKPSVDMSLDLPGSTGYTSNELILVFLDVVNMPEIQEAMGESAARDALDQWTRVLKFLGSQYDGFMIRRMGTSLLFSFPHGKAALDCAKAFMDLIPADTNTESPTPRFRAGVHAGNVSGTRSAQAVKSTAKLVAVAAEGDVLVSGAAVRRVDSSHRLRLEPYVAPAGAAVLAGLNPYRFNWRGEPSTIRRPSAYSQVAVTHVDTEPFAEDAIYEAEEKPGPAIPQDALSEAVAEISGGRDTAAEPEPPVPLSQHTQLRRTTIIHNGTAYHLSPRHAEVTVGRETDNTIVITAPTASRYHAVLRFTEGRFLYIDKSANGSFIYPSEHEPEHFTGEARVLEGTGRISPGCPSDHADSEVLFYKVGSVY